ncbi:glycoside hydrolase family 2 protein [Gryllotalpicola koreensis]|uniref:beta-mannosidase n=1 Tax=Gryllotalpicola koreensis TaxID=993086 RepID=A0ABP8ADA6_9MICO
MSRSPITLSDFEIAEAPLGSTLASLDALTPGDWIPAVVPGGVHESLLAAGRIEHPYRNTNEKDIRWIEERDWWYRGSFAAPTDLSADERLRLSFLGLDTVVDIWLNGEKLGSHQNMFRPAVFDVTERLQAQNELLLRFAPPLAGLEVPASAAEMFARLGDVFAALAPEGDDLSGGGEGMGSEALPLSTLRRKATFSWGWDFGPRVPSVGIWRPVELSREKKAAITGHHVRTDTIDADGTAHVTLVVEVDGFHAEALSVEASVTTPSGITHELTIRVQGGRGEAVLALPHAELWWSHDLGEPALHNVRLQLFADRELVGEVRDRVGIRTIALDQPDDPEGGRLFRFLLNGVPVFARGAAWLPASMLVGSVAPETHRALVRTARDGGMNMLRIWGGGIYEQDAFYEACDEEGVLIWHDFMFACIDYPSELPELQAEVAAEAEYQVRRLRNRASLALWSGNNEVQLIHGFAYQNYEPGNWGWDFFYRILPETVAREDGRTPYWPGSPWGEAPEEGFMAANGVLDGDRHAWEVWHGFDFGAGGGDYASVGEARHYRRYAQDRGKFISEFGIHASPELGTLRRWIDDELLEVHSPTFDAHNKDNPKDKGDALLEIITGLPESIEQYVDFTMVSQAEGLKFGIEHYRRRQPHNNGALIWQFNDVWPGFSWSVVDHDGVPKAGYYFAKRAFAPILASFRLDGDELELWVSNSTAAEASVEALVTIAGFDGGGTQTHAVTATVAPARSQPVWRGPAPADGQFAWVSSPSGAFPDNRVYPREIKDTPFGDARLDHEIVDTGAGAAEITVTAHGHAYFVHIPSAVPGIRFSDNYLDLRDGTSVTIRVEGLPAGFDLDALEVAGYVGTPVRR